jgi:hypothetical protein
LNGFRIPKTGELMSFDLSLDLPMATSDLQRSARVKRAVSYFLNKLFQTDKVHIVKHFGTQYSDIAMKRYFDNLTISSHGFNGQPR